MHAMLNNLSAQIRECLLLCASSGQAKLPKVESRLFGYGAALAVFRAQLRIDRAGERFLCQKQSLSEETLNHQQ
jgi:hypothetical protein